MDPPPKQCSKWQVMCSANRSVMSLLKLHIFVMQGVKASQVIAKLYQRLHNSRRVYVRSPSSNYSKTTLAQAKISVTVTSCSELHCYPICYLFRTQASELFVWNYFAGFTLFHNFSKNWMTVSSSTALKHWEILGKKIYILDFILKGTAKCIK